MSCGLPRCKEARSLVEQLEHVKTRAREWGRTMNLEFVAIVKRENGAYTYTFTHDEHIGHTYEEIDVIFTGAW